MGQRPRSVLSRLQTLVDICLHAMIVTSQQALIDSTLGLLSDLFHLDISYGFDRSMVMLAEFAAFYLTINITIYLQDI